MSTDFKKKPSDNPIILLVEDSDDDAFFFQRALRKTCLSCAFARAANGKVALQLLEKARSDGPGEVKIPGLIFLDLKMPVMSGFEVLEWLKTANFNPPMKVIVLSGSDDHADRRRAAELGATGYLVKPITPEELKRNVEAVIPTLRLPLETGGAR